ncbi:MAG: hypothetical protein K6A63_04130 [Acholeplasmatales bacterium]|nr:hypothetical protein [Acholeplasmatales bacterium]
MRFFKSLGSTLKQVFEKEVTWIDLFLSMLTSFIFALLLVSGPIAILVNLMIYKDSQILILHIMALFIGLGFALWVLFYLKSLSKGEVKGLWRVFILVFILFTLIAGLVMVMLYSKGVIS